MEYSYKSSKLSMLNVRMLDTDGSSPESHGYEHIVISKHSRGQVIVSRLLCDP
jgi:hypothetical protein